MQVRSVLLGVVTEMHISVSLLTCSCLPNDPECPGGGDVFLSNA